MITAAISTIALVMALGPQLHMSLQAMPAESELVDPATTQPDVTEPRDTSRLYCVPCGHLRTIHDSS